MSSNARASERPHRLPGKLATSCRRQTQLIKSWRYLEAGKWSQTMRCADSQQRARWGNRNRGRVASGRYRFRSPAGRLGWSCCRGCARRTWILQPQ